MKSEGKESQKRGYIVNDLVCKHSSQVCSAYKIPASTNAKHTTHFHHRNQQMHERNNTRIERGPLLGSDL